MSKYLTKEQRDEVASIAPSSLVKLKAHADEAERLLVECAAVAREIVLEESCDCASYVKPFRCPVCACIELLAKLKAAGINT